MKPKEGQDGTENFAETIMAKIDASDTFLDRACFSDVAPFYAWKSKYIISASDNPHIVHEDKQDSPKCNVWCGINKDKIPPPPTLYQGGYGN